MAEYVAGREFTFDHNGDTMKIPYESNIDLDGTHPEVTKAVLSLHGISQDPGAYMRGPLAAAELAGVDDGSIAVISPQFMEQEDAGSISPDTPYWEGSQGWKEGDQSIGNGDISSFEVADRVLAELADESQYPNLEQVVVAGNSAGGQFAYRYSMAGADPASIFGDDTDVSYVAMNFNNFPVEDIIDSNPYTSAVGEAQILENFATRSFAPSWGELDVNVQTAQEYADFLQQTFGEGASAVNHELTVVEDLGHGAGDMFRSEPLQDLLWE